MFFPQMLQFNVSNSPISGPQVLYAGRQFTVVGLCSCYDPRDLLVHGFLQIFAECLKFRTGRIGEKKLVLPQLECSETVNLSFHRFAERLHSRF